MKQCPSCHMFMHCRKVLCECGYDFKQGCVTAKPESNGKFRSSRANESPQMTHKRLEESKVRMASLRAAQSPEAAANRLKQSKVLMASLRATQSPEAAAKRLEQNKVHMAFLRASQSPQEALQHRIQQRQRISAFRNQPVSIEAAIIIFNDAINEGPDYVCTVCHRIMCRVSVGVYNRLNYMTFENHLNTVNVGGPLPFCVSVSGGILSHVCSGQGRTRVKTEISYPF